MVEISHTASPIETMEKYYLLATTLRQSGIAQEDLGKLEKIWLQRRDIPSQVYHYAYAAFIAGFTGEPMPEVEPLRQAS